MREARELTQRFVRLTQIMEQVIELIQIFVRLTQMMEQVIEWNDGTGDRTDPGVHHVDRQNINLSRMVGGRRQPISPLWQWNRIYSFSPKDIPFTGEENIIPLMPRNPTAQDFFQLYITDEVIDRIVTETNLYAEQFIEKEHRNLRHHSLVHQWKPANRGEMLSLLGIMIMMEIIYKPRFSIYWSTDTLLFTPVFSQITTKDRVLCLIHFLYFTDNTKHNPADPNRDRLYKCREIINVVKFLQRGVFTWENLTADESLVLFKGTLSFQ